MEQVKKDILTTKKQYRYNERMWGFRKIMCWDPSMKLKKYPFFLNPIVPYASWFHSNTGSPEGILMAVYWTNRDNCSCPDRKYRKRECKHMAQWKAMQELQKKFDPLVIDKIQNYF